MGQPMNSILELQNVTITYKNKIAAEDVSFKVSENQILAIVGESGSGKSTLLRAIDGLLPQTGALTAGRILYKGGSFADSKQRELQNLRGKEIAMIFQNPGEYLNPRRRIESQFMEMLDIHMDGSHEEKRNLAIQMLGRLNLPDAERIMKSYPFQLSGGMNQRVAIAMAISTKPKLLLADEPTSALDVTVQAQVVKELLDLRRVFGTSMILVTHNMAVASKMADQIVVMKSGKVMEYGTRDQVILNSVNPYTRKLLSAVPGLEAENG